GGENDEQRNIGQCNDHGGRRPIRWPESVRGEATNDSTKPDTDTDRSPNCGSRLAINCIENGGSEHEERLNEEKPASDCIRKRRRQRGSRTKREQTFYEVRTDGWTPSLCRRSRTPIVDLRK